MIWARGILAIAIRRAWTIATDVWVDVASSMVGVLVGAACAVFVQEFMP